MFPSRNATFSPQIACQRPGISSCARDVDPDGLTVRPTAEADVIEPDRSHSRGFRLVERMCSGRTRTSLRAAKSHVRQRAFLVPNV